MTSPASNTAAARCSSKRPQRGPFRKPRSTDRLPKPGQNPGFMFVADSKRLTHAGAKKIVDTAVAKARQAGIAISVAVADSGGHLIALERMDGGRFHSLHSATTKAVCAASNKRPTSSHGPPAQAPPLPP